MTISPFSFRIAAALVAVFGFLPVVNWLSGGRAEPNYPAYLAEWGSGGLIVGLGGILLAIVSTRVPLWRDGALRAAAARAMEHPRRVAVVLALATLALYATVALAVYSGRAINIDEIVQLIQAKRYAAGRLADPAPLYPEFTSVLHMLVHRGQVFSQFPPGGPLALAAGLLAGVPWLVGPICSAVAVYAFASAVRIVEPRPSVQLGAVTLFAFTPFAMFLGASHMNHAPTLMWLMIACATLAALTTHGAGARPRWLLALAHGAALGMAAATRPVDAVAFALPAAVWLVVRAVRAGRRARAPWLELAAAGAGVAIPVAVMLLVNARTTGQPFLFGYELLWGTSHGLGFHAAPWGFAHTPARGVELVNLYLLRLQRYLFEAPFPSLLPSLGTLLLTRSAAAFDRYLLASAALLLGLYFAYWHDGFFLGPRFLHPLLPLLALFTARFVALLRERITDGGLAHRAVVYGLGVGAAIALTVSTPIRWRQYRDGMRTLRYDVPAAARDAGVRDALVLVRESWGSQVIARLWALGVPHSETESLYRHVDTCVLEEHVRALEQRGVRDSTAMRVLLPLLADSARVVPSPFSPDDSERVLPGARYTRVCLRRIEEDRAGFTLLVPILAARDRGGNVYVRDLHERDTLMLTAHPGRPVYLLRSPRGRGGEALGIELVPLSRDSLVRAWTGAPMPSAGPARRVP